MGVAVFLLLAFFWRDPQDRTSNLDLNRNYFTLSNSLLLKPFVDDSAFGCLSFSLGRCLILLRVYICLYIRRRGVCWELVYISILVSGNIALARVLEDLMQEIKSERHEDK